MKNEILSELIKIDPSFSQEKINLPYKVPNEYFDNLTDRVMENVSKSKTESLVKRLFTFRHTWSIAASVLIVLCTWYVLTIKSASSTGISAEDAIVYIENNIDEFDEYSLEELASLSDLTESSSMLNLSEDMLDQIIDELDEDEIADLF